jgi:hypothetical protein
MSEKLLPCPFCGSTDLEILPEDPSRDGDAWGAVQCVNVDCSTYDILKSHGVRVEDGQDVSDERGSDAYKSAAIAAWNRRTPAPEGEAVCSGCEGRPVFPNVPCAVCGASPVVPVGVSDQQRAKIELVLVGYRNRITTLDAATDAIIAALRPTDTGANHD